MSWVLCARLVLVAAVVAVAAVVSPFPGAPAANAVLGVLVAAAVIGLERGMHGVSGSRLFGAIVGAGAALGLALMLTAALRSADADPATRFARAALMIVLPYVGLLVGARRGEWLEPARILSLLREGRPSRECRVLDTSVIIDGRIADVCETGFLDGPLVVPRFVLSELQAVADSTESLKRNRGRRGLDILQRMQKVAGVEIVVSDLDFPGVGDVDSKLIELALRLGGKVVTNDVNLNKVAQLRGVDVLNVNELANALKPVVLPGEFMTVFILKEGKEYNQGVAYLDDGTMVVVENARKLIGCTIDVVVTSVLQTTAGKMIFGRHIEAAAGADAHVASGRNEAFRKPRVVPGN